MTFYSLPFLCFFLIVAVLIQVTKTCKQQHLILLLANIVFYGYWDIRFLLLLFSVITVCYGCALQFEKTHKKGYITVSVVFCLLILSILKYLNFFIDSFCTAFKIPQAGTLNIILPLGISYYLFQAMSYMLDVRKGVLSAEKNYIRLAVYISFFPQITSGPIVKAHDFLPQLDTLHRIKKENVFNGIQLFVLGMTKKLVFADRIGIAVDAVFNAPAAYNGISIAFAIIGYSLQIYCDFSGYSDMAVGIAKILDFDLGKNFDLPYLAKNPSDFWNRWHISLSTWFRDYLYIPLGGNRKGSIRKYLNLMITFVVSGLWHGASFTFIIWGALHGLLQVVEYILHIKAEESRGIRRVLRVMCVFVIVSLAWVFFRAHSVNEAVYVFKHLFDGISSPVSYCLSGFTELGFGRLDLLVCVMFYLAPLAVFDRISLEKDVISAVGELQPVLRWILYSAFTAMVAMLFYSSMNPSFIYFQF